MNINASRETAKILQFPRRTRAGAPGLGRDLSWTAAAQLEPCPAVDFGSGWYHQAAVEDDKRGRK